MAARWTSSTVSHPHHAQHSGMSRERDTRGPTAVNHSRSVDSKCVTLPANNGDIQLTVKLDGNSSVDRYSIPNGAAASTLCCAAWNPTNDAEQAICMDQNPSTPAPCSPPFCPTIPLGVEKVSGISGDLCLSVPKEPTNTHQRFTVALGIESLVIKRASFPTSDSLDIDTTVYSYDIAAAGTVREENSRKRQCVESPLRGGGVCNVMGKRICVRDSTQGTRGSRAPRDDRGLRDAQVELKRHVPGRIAAREDGECETAVREALKACRGSDARRDTVRASRRSAAFR
ncbi:hypothetical protein WN55_08042 [Dufourea novaeangliae]|uniref:Uncharacterized protein n=1 Tax=Dufourea novaeangliae TaxID=178035 RepID=A0A154P777_DUFNO|nr:hypothetical protein WN55_08042 [Dufourea novaeangliae]